VTQAFENSTPIPGQDSFDPLYERVVAIGHDMLRSLQATVVEILGGPISYLSTIPAADLQLAGCCLVTAGLMGYTMARVNKPESQLASRVIRGVGWCMQWAAIVATFFTVLTTLLVVGAFAILDRNSVLIDVFKSVSSLVGQGAIVGLVLCLYPIFRGIPIWERGAGLPDVEELVQNFKQFHGYDPRPFFKISEGCFVGKNLDGKPTYVPWQKLRETHVQVLSTTGCGKGVLMTIIAVQAIAAGEALVWLDPKSDRFAPRLLRQAALEANKPFVMLDLNLGQPPQFSLFASATEFEILDLFVAGLDLRGKGTDGDFHRGRDEDAAMVVADIAVLENIRSISGLVAACAGIKEVTGAENFWRHLRKLARLDVIDTDAGVDLAETIAQGGVIYVRGSADTEVVKTLQKMVLARIAQIIKARPESDVDKPVCVVLDELKHLLSMPAVVSLGVIRSFGAHFLLAHQSLGDLESCASIPPIEVRGAVIVGGCVGRRKYGAVRHWRGQMARAPKGPGTSEWITGYSE
jgi:hypothetical protein